MKKLADEQIESFDVDYVQNHGGWEHIKGIISKNFPDGKFSFLDIGGGNGLFSDRILEYYMKSEGTIVDNSNLLLNKNKINNRKIVIEGSAEFIKEKFNNKKFDFVFFNWILHHLVKDKYKDTHETISKCIKDARDLLTDNGRILIFENCYVSLTFEVLPSRIIYHALSSKSLANITRRMSANTGGVGVFYLSERLWRSVLEKEELNIDSCVCIDSLKIGFLYKILCQMRGINIVHFSCSKHTKF